jgi:hypothetical protein
MTGLTSVLTVNPTTIQQTTRRVHVMPSRTNDPVTAVCLSMTFFFTTDRKFIWSV